MNYLWIASVLLCLVTVYGSVTCPKRNERCTCLPGSEFEYHCPPNSVKIGGVVIHIKQDLSLVTIDCYPLMTSTTVSSDDQHPNITSPKFFDVDILPDAKIGKISRLEIRFCPLPKLNFLEIVEKLSITGLKYLKFANSDMESIKLSGSYFEGLETLETLVIDKNKLLILEDDVFDNTPNLLDIKLTESNLKLSSEVFKKTPLLKELDISGNLLEELPKGLFRPLKNLSRLDLWNNNLTSIDESTFEGLSNLKSLELSANNIKSISENAFRNLGQLLQIRFKKNNVDLIPVSLFQGNFMLQKIVMSRNPSLKIPRYLFSNLSSLEYVELSDCNLESVPEHLFENSIFLKTLSLSHNRLKDLPKILFMALQNLEKLELQFNLIEDVSDLFAHLNKLKRLDLEKNLITRIERATFANLTNLEYLNLGGNQISRIHISAFDHQMKLKTVQLSQNLITGEVEDLGVVFQNVYGLEEIDLSYNRIKQVEDIISIANKPRLSKVDLRYNQIVKITLQSLKTVTTKGRLTIRLENNNITTVHFNPFLEGYNQVDAFNNDMAYSEIHLANNPLNCDCHNYEFLRYLRRQASKQAEFLFKIIEKDLICASPDQLKNLSLATLRPKLLTCPLEEIVENYTECSDVCSCSWRPSDMSIVVNCSNKNLLKYPEIVLPPKQLNYKQFEVHLEHNCLTTGPGSDLILYKNVTKLYLSYNKISTITWLPPRLQVLKLDNNELNSLNNDIIEALNTTSLLELTLANNPRLCESSSENLKDFLWQHARQVDITNIHCSNTDSNKKMELIYVIITIMVIFFASIVLVIVLCNPKRQKRTETLWIKLYAI